MKKLIEMYNTMTRWYILVINNRIFNKITYEDRQKILERLIIVYNERHNYLNYFDEKIKNYHSTKTNFKKQAKPISVLLFLPNNSQK